MVRRLIQHFLHWPRSILAQVRGLNDSRRPPEPPQQLPPSPQHPAAANSQEQPNSVSTPSLPNEPLAPEASPVEQPIQAPDPADTGVASASKFKMLLSDYRYSPNPAIQDLSRQLSQPPAQTKPQPIATQPSQSNPELSEPDLPDSENSFSLKTGPLPAFPTIQKESSLEEKSTPSPPNRISHISDARPSETETDSLWENTPVGTIADSGIITKQGVVKLLFKLKQNNHHGYIEPNDGSKDIIFHQKYIGHEIFRQLERGMAVEVTAHITAGKAYADHIRIL